MINPSNSKIRWILGIAGVALLAACTDETPVAPESPSDIAAQLTVQPGKAPRDVIAKLRRVTARYQNMEKALVDGFVLLHPCEERPGEGPVGTVLVHMGRLLDGVIDINLPDALIYEPAREPRLVGVEFAIPYSMWTQQEPPTFYGATFQPEDEFGVWALHAWVWRDNPDGMFAEANPRVSCGVE
jgi:hypothetical protein